MPTTVQFRRGTTVQNGNFTGSAGELTVDTDKVTLRVHDGSTAGGKELVNGDGTQTLTNKTISGSSNTLSDIANGSLTNSSITFAGDSGSTAASLGGTVTIAGGTGLTSAESSGTVTLNLDDTAVSAGEYGSATAIPVITVDAQGRLTAASTVSVSSDMSIAGDSGTDTITVGSDTFTIAGGTGVTTTASTDQISIAIGQAVGTSDNVTFNDLTLSGNLTVNGTTTTVATTNTVVSDSLIELGNGTTGTPGNDAGIVIERGDSNNAFIGFDESADKFIVGTGTFTGASTGNLSITTGTLVANVEGNVTGDLTGNADTATALATARAFSLTGDVTASGVNFDGTGAVSLTTSIGANTVGVTELNVTDGTNGQFLQTNGSGTLTFATVSTPTLASLGLDTSDDVQFDSFGVGTAASGTTGEIRATNTITAYYSDERLKENIELIPDAVEKVKQLRGVRFNSNTIAESYGYTDKSKQVGVIAQDVEKVLPEIVVPAPFDRIMMEGTEISKSGQEYKTVHYDKIVPLLIEAIKEQQEQIDALKAKLEG